MPRSRRRTALALASATVDADDPPPIGRGGRGPRGTGPALAATSPCPIATIGVVVFAHGSGSSRHSPRNRYVAGVLNEAGLGTLLFDLLTTAEEHDRANVFDIDLLARRLVDVTRWLRTQPESAALPVGYFGASTGAAAALWAATEPDADIARSCRVAVDPISPRHASSAVTAPTLLIVGGHDHVVLDLNRQAASATALREPPRGRARRHPPVRGTRHAPGRRASSLATGSSTISRPGHNQCADRHWGWTVDPGSARTVCVRSQ